MHEPSVADGVRGRWQIKPKRIVRKKEAYGRLGCGHTKFYSDYVLRDAKNPYVPGTRIERLKPIPLGPRNVGFLDSELDALIDGLAELRTSQRMPRPERGEERLPKYDRAWGDNGRFTERPDRKRS